MRRERAERSERARSHPSSILFLFLSNSFSLSLVLFKSLSLVLSNSLSVFDLARSAFNPARSSAGST